MSKENNIDRLFRNNLNETEHAFNENAWAQMEEMLDAQAGSGSSFWYKMGSVATILIFLTSFATYLTIDTSYNSLSSLNIVDITQSNNELLSVENSFENPNTQYESASLGLDNDNSKPEIKVQGKDNSLAKINSLVPISSSSVGNSLADLSILPITTNNDYSKIRTHNNEDIAMLEKQSFEDYANNIEYLAVAPQDPVATSQISNKRHNIGVVLGNTFNKGFENKTGIFGQNILHTVGLEYTFQLNNQIRLITGIQLRSKASDGTVRNYESEEYGFGKTTSSVQIDARSLQYIEIPLLVDYNIARKHHVFAGTHLGYLTGVKNNIVNRTEETLAGTETKTEIQWGMEEYYNPLNVSIVGGYDYELSPKIKLGINAQFGVTDFTNNKAWDNNSKNFHQELQISLKYNLVRL